MSDVAPDRNGGLARILRAVGGERMLEILADDHAGSDLTSLLLAVFRRRACRLTPANVMRQYERDRFVAPASVTFEDLDATERSLLAALPPEFERLTLSPLVPLGTHSVLAPVAQNRVVTTVRGSEVAADATNGLALEAARRRHAMLRNDERARATVRLAATQRVVRAQAYDEQPGLI
jgi:hypothetical protein